MGTKGHSVEIADEKHPPDCVVITTCAFLEVAKEQSRDQIRRWVRIRKDHGTRLGVIGCMSQRHGPELMRDFPEIDFLAGVGQFDKVAELVCGDGRSRFVTDTAEDARSWNLTQQSGGDAPEAIPYDDREFAVDAPRVIVPRTLPRQRMDRRPHGFLKISDGCNHTCTFCSIPLMKGVYTSVPRQTLMDETRRLLDDGVREINIVAQDITKYGLDTEKRMALPDLLNDLCTIGGDFWIRLFYLYPSTVTKDLLAVVRDNPKIARYLDIPLQHLSESVLKRMRRPHDRKRTMEMLRSIRSEFPEITLRTTFIVGFPGESGAEFQELLDGMDEIKFERLGVFTYSREAGTPAADLPNQLPRAHEENPPRQNHETPGRHERGMGRRTSRSHASYPDRRRRPRFRLVRWPQRQRSRRHRRSRASIQRGAAAGGRLRACARDRGGRLRPHGGSNHAGLITRYCSIQPALSRNSSGTGPSHCSSPPVVNSVGETPHAVTGPTGKNIAGP
jgi:ribosomal protein S12 methylthiotransferase